MVQKKRQTTYKSAIYIYILKFISKLVVFLGGWFVDAAAEKTNDDPAEGKLVDDGLGVVEIRISGCWVEPDVPHGL